MKIKIILCLLSLFIVQTSFADGGDDEMDSSSIETLEDSSQSSDMPIMEDSEEEASDE